MYLNDKTLCDLKKKDIKEAFEDVVALVDTPRYICEKCARVANDKKSLCKPRPLDKK